MLFENKPHGGAYESRRPLQYEKQGQFVLPNVSAQRSSSVSSQRSRLSIFSDKSPDKDPLGILETLRYVYKSGKIPKDPKSEKKKTVTTPTKGATTETPTPGVADDVSDSDDDDTYEYLTMQNTKDEVFDDDWQDFYLTMYELKSGEKTTDPPKALSEPGNPGADPKQFIKAKGNDLSQAARRATVPNISLVRPLPRPPDCQAPKSKVKLRSVDDIPNDVTLLDVENVCTCLTLLNMHEHVDQFRKNQIDGCLLVSLEEKILQTDFGFSLFEARKLMQFAKAGWRPRDTTNLW